MSQGPSGGIGATCKAIDPPGEAKMDTEVTLNLFKAMGKPWDSDRGLQCKEGRVE